MIEFSGMRSPGLRYTTRTLVVLILFVGCGKPSNNEQSRSFIKKLEDPVAIRRVEKFCGDCHPIPSPSYFPKDQWPGEIEQGYQFYRDSNRQDLDEPILKDTLRYFQFAAPDKVEVPTATELKNFPTNVEFRPSALVVSADATSVTSHIVWEKESNSIIFADMSNGKVRRFAPPNDFRKVPNNEPYKISSDTEIAHGKHSCRLKPCDWNSDGKTDYLLGEIGSTTINDLREGNISLLLQNSDKSFRRILLAVNLARSIAATPFDYDEDGDLDILISEYGHHKAGSITMLRNEGASPDDPKPEQFRYEVIDPRHGNLGIEIADVNGDQKLDLVTSFGQEYETVEVFYNLGSGKYNRVELVRFPDPSFNSSSIRVADVNADGKPDIIHTCGDIMDSFLPKSINGVRLLQQSQDSWQVRELGMLIGAMHTAVADFDLDGDLDIAAVGLFPNDYLDISYDSIVWWEQSNGEFLRHTIERDHCFHVTCEAADVNQDGRPDLIVGEWKDGDIAASLRVFWNLSTAK